MQHVPSTLYSQPSIFVTDNRGGHPRANDSFNKDNVQFVHVMARRPPEVVGQTAMSQFFSYGNTM